jgi:hypothetical protein
MKTKLNYEILIKVKNAATLNSSILAARRQMYKTARPKSALDADSSAKEDEH